MPGKKSGNPAGGGGFKARDAVEQMNYDFNPHLALKGTIPEPSSDQVDAYRTAIGEAVKELGIDPATLTGGGVRIEELGDMMSKAGDLERDMLRATADLTQIDFDQLVTLPYRISRAFMGWVMGAFFDPEA